MFISLSQVVYMNVCCEIVAKFNLKQFLCSPGSLVTVSSFFLSANIGHTWTSFTHQKSYCISTNVIKSDGLLPYISFWQRQRLSVTQATRSICTRYLFSLSMVKCSYLLLVLVHIYVCTKHYLCTWLLHIAWSCTKKIICTQHCSVCYSFHIVSFSWEEVMRSGRQNIGAAVWYVSDPLLSSVIQVTVLIIAMLLNVLHCHLMALCCLIYETIHSAFWNSALYW